MIAAKTSDSSQQNHLPAGQGGCDLGRVFLAHPNTARTVSQRSEVAALLVFIAFLTSFTRFEIQEMAAGLARLRDHDRTGLRHSPVRKM